MKKEIALKGIVRILETPYVPKISNEFKTKLILDYLRKEIGMHPPYSEEKAKLPPKPHGYEWDDE